MPRFQFSLEDLFLLTVFVATVVCAGPMWLTALVATFLAGIWFKRWRRSGTVDIPSNGPTRD